MSIPTPADRQALDETLAELRTLDRAALELVATQLTMAAAGQGTPKGTVLILLARVAYVLAHEGLRG